MSYKQMKTIRLHAGLFILKKASTAEQRYEKEEWKGKLHAYGVQSVTRAYSPLPLPPPPPDVNNNLKKRKNCTVACSFINLYIVQSVIF
jgi:hypothetical protein